MFNGISIIVATRGRIELLQELLQSVSVARSLFQHKSEIIIVDDSSSEDIQQIEELCQKYDAKKIYFTPSVAEKRNIGAKNAKYELLLFLDSDCTVTPNILNEHYELYINKKVGGVAGYLKFIGESSWFWNVVNCSPFVVCFEFPRWLNEVPWTPTANFSIRKTCFFEVNGFDKSFPNKPGGEDVDLGLRITKKGYIIKCSKKGLVYHNKKTWASPREMFKRLWHYGVANYYLIKKHEDYATYVLPRKSLVYGIILLLLAILSILSFNPLFLIIFPIWLVFDILLTSVFFNISRDCKNISLLQQIILQFLLLDYEFGYVYMCTIKRSPRYLFKDMIYFDGQMEEILHNSAISTWCNLLSLASLFSCILLYIFL